jgi:hypothetical protein
MLLANQEILRGVYPEPKDEILYFVQDDKRGAQDDEKRLYVKPLNI